MHAVTHCLTDTIVHSALFPERLLATKITNPMILDKVGHWAQFFPNLIRKIADSFPRQITAFDALVGENACHTRAAKLLGLTAVFYADPAFRQELQQLRDQDFSHATPISFATCPKNLEFRQYLQTYNLEFNLTNRVAYLVRCYLLTLIKQQEEVNHRIIQKKNCKILQPLFSNTEAAALVDMHQKFIAMDSCEYLYHEATLLQQSTLVSVFPNRLHVEDRSGRPAIPALLAMEVLMKRAIEQSQPLLLTISRCEGNALYDQLDILFLSSPERGFYPLDAAPQHNMHHMTIKGLTQYLPGQVEDQVSYRERLLQIPLFDLLMANASSLPQYADQAPGTPLPFAEWYQTTAKGSDREVVENFERRCIDYKALSLRGCSYQDPSLFCIDHIFCGSSG